MCLALTQKEIKNFAQDGEMKFKTTPMDIFQAGCWEDFCERHNVDLFITDNGLQENEPIYISVDEADEYGLLKHPK